MKIEEDCFFDRMRKEVMLSPDDASIRQEGYERHSRGESIDDVAVKVRVNVHTKYSNKITIVRITKYPASGIHS